MNTANEPLPQRAECPVGLAVSPFVGFALALLAGAISWGVVQRVHPVFHVPKEFEAPNIGMSAEVNLNNRLARERVERQHAMLYVGLLGLLVGGALGLGEGAARRSILPPLVTAPLGALGGVIGGLAGCLVHLQTLAHVGQPQLADTLKEQIFVLTPLGLAIGLGLGLTLRSLTDGIKAALAGLAAGLVAGFAYPVAVSVLLPRSSTDMLLPFDLAGRVLWFGLASGLLGLLIPVAGRSRHKAIGMPSTVG